MKFKDSTTPAAHAASKTIFSSASARQPLDVASRFRAHIVGLYHNDQVGKEWDTHGRLESDYLHHIEIAFSGRRRVIFNRKVLELLPGHAYWFPGNTPLERRWQEPAEVLYMKLQCEWLPGLDPFLDWPERRPALIGPCNLADWRSWLEPDFTPTANHLLHLNAWVLEAIAKVIPDLNGLIVEHLKTRAKFNTVFALIEAKLGGDLRIEELARAHGTSLHAFSMSFTRNTGLTPKAYLKRRLNQKALLLVLNTNLKIKEIAAQLNFCDEFHFIRFFSDMNGQPPGQYRINLQRKGEPA